MIESRRQLLDQAAQVFVTRHGPDFAVYNGRWWRLAHNRRWVPDAARAYAEHLIPELTAFLPLTGDDRGDRWIQAQLRTTWGKNQILARVGWLLRCDFGLPGPECTDHPAGGTEATADL